MDDLKELSNWIFGALMALLAWLGKRQVKRIDDIEAQLAQSVKKTDLDRTLDRLVISQEKFMERIEGKLERIHERVDELWDRK